MCYTDVLGLYHKSVLKIVIGQHTHTSYRSVLHSLGVSTDIVRVDWIPVVVAGLEYCSCTFCVCSIQWQWVDTSLRTLRRSPTTECVNTWNFRWEDSSSFRGLEQHMCNQHRDCVCECVISSNTIPKQKHSYFGLLTMLLWRKWSTVPAFFACISDGSSSIKCFCNFLLVTFTHDDECIFRFWAHGYWYLQEFYSIGKTNTHKINQCFLVLT